MGAQKALVKIFHTFPTDRQTNEPKAKKRPIEAPSRSLKREAGYVVEALMACPHNKSDNKISFVKARKGLV